MEERRRETHRFGQRLEPTGHPEIGRLDRADQEGHRERAERDAQLQHAVGEDRSREPSHIARRRRRTEGEAAHVGREHGDHGELRCPEQERELPCPGGLVQQRSEAGDEEADEEEEEAKVHGACLILSWGAGAAPENERPELDRPWL